MKGLGIENKITLNHIVLGYKIDDKNYLALNLQGFPSTNRTIYLNRKQSILMFIEYLSMNILKENKTLYIINVK